MLNKILYNKLNNILNNILNIIFSVNPKGMLRPLSYMELCMWEMLYTMQREGFKPFVPVVGPRVYKFLKEQAEKDNVRLRAELAFGKPKHDPSVFFDVTS